MNTTIKKLFLTLSLLALIPLSTLPVQADTQTLPTQPTPPVAPTAPTPPTQPTPPSDPTVSVSPTPTIATQQPTATPTPSVSSTQATPSATPTNSTPQANDPSNIGNGASSTNNAAATQNSQSSSSQNNTAATQNTLNQTTRTGKNTSSDNTGDSTLTTGNANVSGTAITAENSNVEGLSVSEFNINDNHTGDIILDFSSHCIYGCGVSAPNVVSNIGNGTNSTNTTASSQAQSDTNFQKNDGTVGNTLVLSADSGSNKANENTNGNTSMQTGNANVSANALNFLNNNATGKVVYGVVNIYGDLNGDIILPDSALQSTGQDSSDISNAGNGANSQNASSASSNTQTTTAQANLADIKNNLSTLATTGGNDVSENTGGTNTTQSGTATNDSHVINIANTNVSNGNVWLVLINQAGQWVGKIIGLPNGANIASSGLGVSVDSNGNVTATNAGNGANSQNTSSASSNTQTTQSQSNSAGIQNNLQLSANTGQNSANDNTGGNVGITTGDAHILANIVNFVNNNIVGNGKLFVTVVNVFGKWVGNFVGPGQQKEATASNTNSTSSQSSQANTQTTHQQQAIPTPVLGVTTNSVHQTQNTPIAPMVGILTSQQAPKQPLHTTVAGVNKMQKPPITINLAWLLIGVIPVGAALAVRKILRLRK